jgi:Family of unknown function (DUF6286)
MIRRPRRAIPATLVAVIGLGVAVVVTASCIQVLAHRRAWLPFPAMARFGAGLAVNSPVVLAVAAAVALLGLILLGAALAPGVPTVLPLDPGESGLDIGATRASLITALRAAAAGVDGVEKARVRLRRRRLTATVHTPLHTADGLDTQVRAAITDRLDDIAPARRPRIRVVVSTTKE